MAAILDFKEIPRANVSDGEQDRFEFFARDFLEYLGYKIVTGPNRGADGGVDVLVEEKRTGVGGATVIRWLVSCKHKAHSGQSVTPQDEANIRDRVEANNCHGFIGFYSTLPSTGLSKNLEGMRGKIEYQIFDNEKIEKDLLKSSAGIELAARYFPISISAWKRANPSPVEVSSETYIRRLNLYDKRFSVFQALKELLLAVARMLNITCDELDQFTANIQEATFLFDKEIPEYLKRVRKNAVQLMFMHEQLSQSGLPPGEQRSKLAQEHSDICKWFIEQFDVSQEMFAKYLRFTQ
jgi:hypothetical protein